MIQTYNSFLSTFVSIVEIVLNSIGIIIVLKAVIIGTIRQRKGKGSAKHIICKGISNALNYNLATEVMKIIISQGVKDLWFIGGILILKVMITVLFMLELKQDEMQEKAIKKHNDNNKEILKKVFKKK